MSKIKDFFDKKFNLTAKGTSVKTEILAGLTTFMAMVYILMVNADMFVATGAVSYGAMYISTALSAILGTVLIGILSGLPLAQAPGMGLNAFFVFTMCIAFGFTYANALVFILIDGLVFILLTVTGLRKAIFEAIPDAVKKAIPAGIGLFIAFIGLQNSGLVVLNPSTKVAMGSMNVLSISTSWMTPVVYAVEDGIELFTTPIAPLLVVVAGVIAIAAMSKKKVKGAILWGILGSAVLYYIFGGIGALCGDASSIAVFESISLANPFDAFAEFGTQAFGKVFTEGFDFSAFITANGVPQFILLLITSSLAFCLVDMFDTLGTLYGACKAGDLLDKDGNVPNLNKAMMADAVATTAGAILGTSTVTTFVESSAGCAEGGKTSLTSYVVAILFAVAMFLSPIAQLIPSAATATALIYVGVLMITNVADIDWKDAAVALPSFLTIAMMSFTYNISFGIGFGLLSYVIIAIATGKAKEVKVSTYVLTLIFLAMFLLTH